MDTEKLGNQHNWKPLPEAKAKQLMAIYESELPTWVKKNGDSILLYTTQGNVIAEGYTRVVIGHYGSYFEFDKDKNQIYTIDLVIKKGQEWRLLPKYAGVKYNWLCLKDDESVKVYQQRGTVSYADYKVGMFYVGTNELFPEIRASSVSPPPASSASEIAPSASETITQISKTKVFAITGHRPKDLGRDANYDIEDPIYDDIRAFFKLAFSLAIAKYGLENVTCISGMAQGVDQIAAQVALEMGIKLHAYIPFRGQEKPWKDARSLTRYSDLLLRGNVTDCGEGATPRSKEESSKLLLARNRAMVDDADQVLAVFNGSMTGGTAACIRYAIQKGVRVTRYNPINRQMTDDFKIVI